MTGKREPSTVENALSVAHGVTIEERDRIVAGWGRLDARLRSFPAGAVELQLTVKERGTPSQRTTLEAWIDRRQRLVATSTHIGFDDAIAEVRDDLIRQITDAKTRTEPRNNRSLRQAP
jgi:hypothetical protein